MGKNLQLYKLLILAIHKAVPSSGFICLTMHSIPVIWSLSSMKLRKEAEVSLKSKIANFVSIQYKEKQGATISSPFVYILDATRQNFSTNTAFHAIH